LGHAVDARPGSCGSAGRSRRTRPARCPAFV
jgi:hypothetical protein